MMMNKRLIAMVSESRKHVALAVVFQWIGLIANVVMMGEIARFLQALLGVGALDMQRSLWIMGGAILVRVVMSILTEKEHFESSRTVKKKIREMIYKKLLAIGSSYTQDVKTSEIVQVASEGVEQLETYFGAYLPQFFYAMLAPLTLFFILLPVSWSTALVLLICVPLIPVAIAMVQTWAKKLLSKYWGEYTALGDNFLENLQGLTTLKIYQTDGIKHKEMNKQAERFRVITMKVLSMQLNSITIMDFIAYGGAALGMIMACSQYAGGKISLAGCLFIILISADFFLPMRSLGSFFHVAMNGMAAADKIFNLLDIDVKGKGEKRVEEAPVIELKDLSFSYDGTREVLRDITFTVPEGSFTAIAGVSGSGKSTIASLIMGRAKGYSGSLKTGGIEQPEILEESLMETVTYVGHQSPLFKGTVRENLLMGKPDADDRALEEVLDRVNLKAFLDSENGLETKLQERGENFSGGQRQRLALARALLHDTPVYIFDEATSNIDVESENAILDEIKKLKGEKTVLFITHRLANVTEADEIVVIENGEMKEKGTHAALLKKGGVYADLFNTQQELEHYEKGAF